MAKKRTTKGNATKKAAPKVRAKTKASARSTKKKTASAKTAERKTSKKKVAAKRAVASAKKIVTKKKAGSTTSTKKRVRPRSAKKKPMANAATSATSLDPIQFPEMDKPVPKTHLKAKELREYKQLLLRKRAELAGDVLQLTDVVTKRTGEGASDHSAMPIHMADLGSDNWEQEFTLGLISNERDRIRDIDDALGRIEDKSYGVCVATHRAISQARLRAKPWAKYCIDYARAREEGRSS